MEIKNKAQLLEFIRKQSLALINENQAFAALEDKLKDVDEGFVQVNEKRFEKLRAEEDSAMAEENYVELERIKKEKVSVLAKLIASYKKKTELLEQIHDGIKQELDMLGVHGGGVFKNKPITEFNNEDFQKGNTVKFITTSSETTVTKLNDNNQYSIVSTNAPGMSAGDILALPDMAIGSSARITVYRKIGDRFQQVGMPELSNIKEIIKNPS